MTTENDKYMTVRYKTQPIPPDIHRLNQIADVTIHPDLIPDDIERVQGYVQVFTSENTEEPALKIPFDEKFLYGSLDFNEQDAYFYLSDTQRTDDCQPMKLFNRFKTPISVYNIVVNKMELLSRYIQVTHKSLFENHTTLSLNLDKISFISVLFIS